MKLTKNTLKKIIREELEDGALTADTSAVDPDQLEQRFEATLKDAIKGVDEAIAKPLVGKLISGYEDEGPVIKAYVYDEGYGGPLSIVAVFKDRGASVAKAFID